MKKHLSGFYHKDLTSQNAIVAVGAGKIVGLVHFIFHPHNWKIEDVCYLQDLYVSDTLRGQGIGRLLIEAVYDEADNGHLEASQQFIG